MYLNEITSDARELMLIGIGLDYYNYSILLEKLNLTISEFDELSKDIFIEINYNT